MSASVTVLFWSTSKFGASWKFSATPLASFFTEIEVASTFSTVPKTLMMSLFCASTGEAADAIKAAKSMDLALIARPFRDVLAANPGEQITVPH
jgi:hypothetical protein